MDSVSFDTYATYSDSSSTPRTPSPRTSDGSDDLHSYSNYKPSLDTEPLRNIFSDHPSDEPGIAPEVEPPFWSTAQNNSFFHSPHGSLLKELYDEPSYPQNHHQLYMNQSAEPPYGGSNGWSHTQPHHSQTLHQQRPHEYGSVRRATFPYVRHDREDGALLEQQQHHHQQHAQYNHHQHPSFMTDHQPILGNPFASRSDALYGKPMLPQQHSRASLNIKSEDPAPVIVPSQSAFYRPSSQSSHHPMAMSYLSPHTGLPVQHTDDAASKETQYLRRRCFNCHTTEPPSWRRSTLNPGKIVCNKCGLYERTHLRPRPLRFDELRAGNKARKQSKGTLSPKPAKIGGIVKKEPQDFGLVRRSSTTSSSSSVHSSTSDWDDNVSAYSSGSAPPSSYNSPAVATYSIPRDPSSQSPPRDGGIRLPNNPLSDIASLQQPPSVPSSPRKAAIMPSPAPSSYYPTPPSTASTNGSPPQAHNPMPKGEFYRRPSMPEMRQELSEGSASTTA